MSETKETSLTGINETTETNEAKSPRGRVTHVTRCYAWTTTYVSTSAKGTWKRGKKVAGSRALVLRIARKPSREQVNWLTYPLRSMPRPKIELFQWSADTVAKELGFKRDTFLRNAAEQNITPGEQGKYTSKQVFRAMTGDARRRLEQERLLLVQQQRQKLELENGEAEGRLVDADVVLHTYGTIFSYIKTIIFASDLSEQEKKDVSAELQRIVTETPEWVRPDKEAKQ